MRIAISDGQKLLRTKTVATPADFTVAMTLIKELSAEISAGAPIQAVVAGVPGPLDRARARMVNAGNLPGWNQRPLKRELQKLTSGPVYLENDAALAGLGEAIYGAGRDYQIVAYFTVSTGVGGARIVNGRIDAATIGFEPGHQVIAGTASQPVYLESLISGAGLSTRYQMDVRYIKSPHVWQKVTRSLAIGLNNLIVHWSPEIIILGGGIILHRAINLTALQKELRTVVKIFDKLPVIKRAALGDQAGLYGGMVYLQSHATIAQGLTR